MNKKILKNIIRIIVILILILFIFGNNTYAKNNNITLKQVKNNVCEIELDDTGLFKKRIISVDDVNKEVIMQMDIENVEKERQTTEPIEIIFVIDNSGSMNMPIDRSVENSYTRQYVINTGAKKLVNKIVSAFSNVKIGVVEFDSNAAVCCQPTSEINTIMYAIDSIQADLGGTNTEKGVVLAHQQFTIEKNRIMILLTDGAPGSCSISDADESTVIYKTLQALQCAVNDYIDIITVLTEVDNTFEVRDGYKEKEVADQIFGTQENPNFGEFYYVSDNSIEDTILNRVYSSASNYITNYMSNTLFNINMVDIFPNNIIENYDIEIIKNANIGTAYIDSNKLYWKLDKLEEGQNDYIQYKLKLKDNYNSSILNLEMDTNEDVDIKYEDKYRDLKSENSTTSPSIILTEKDEFDIIVDEENYQSGNEQETNNIDIVDNTTINEDNNSNIIINNKAKEDNTYAKVFLPQTGSNIVIVFIILIAILNISIIIYKRIKN